MEVFFELSGIESKKIRKKTGNQSCFLWTKWDRKPLRTRGTFPVTCFLWTKWDRKKNRRTES